MSKAEDSHASTVPDINFLARCRPSWRFWPCRHALRQSAEEHSITREVLQYPQVPPSDTRRQILDRRAVPELRLHRWKYLPYVSWFGCPLLIIFPIPHRA